MRRTHTVWIYSVCQDQLTARGYFEKFQESVFLFWHLENFTLVSFPTKKLLCIFKNTMLPRTWTLKEAVHRQFVSTSSFAQLSGTQWRTFYNKGLSGFWLMKDWCALDTMLFIQCCDYMRPCHSNANNPLFNMQRGIVQMRVISCIFWWRAQNISSV